MLGLPGYLGDQIEPALKKVPDAVTDGAIRPAGGDHLLQHLHISGLQIVFEEVARLLVALPEWTVLGVHLGLAGETTGVLGPEKVEDELLLGAEVVVQLAQRNPR